MEDFVFLKLVDVYDDKVFTESRAKGWQNHILNCYEAIFDELCHKLNGSPIEFAINESLLDEVILDAILDMRKITDVHLHEIEDPNSLKIAAYLTYWWLRHKPIYVHYEGGSTLDDIVKFPASSSNEDKKQKLIWEIKHINELVAVHIVTSYIFDFGQTVCNLKQCQRIKRCEGDKFCFDSFEQMQDVMINKLKYYFSYRTIDPKIIEHILEAYTIHPAWSWTGPHWSIKKNG